MQQYRYDIHNKMIKVLYKKKQLYYNKLFEQVGIRSRDVFDRYLCMLEDQGIVEKDKKEDWKNGTKRYCRLSKNTRLALKLKWPIKVKVGKKEFFFLLPKKQSEINQKIYLLLIALATINFMVPKPVKVLSDVKPGDIYIKGKPHRFAQLPGICANDILHPYRDSANAWLEV